MELSRLRSIGLGLACSAVVAGLVFERATADTAVLSVAVPTAAGAPIQITACIAPLKVRVRNLARRELLGFTARFRQYDRAKTKLSDDTVYPHVSSGSVSLDPGEAGTFWMTGPVGNDIGMSNDTRVVRCEITSARFAGLKTWNSGTKWSEKLHAQ